MEGLRVAFRKGLGEALIIENTIPQRTATDRRIANSVSTAGVSRAVTQNRRVRSQEYSIVAGLAWLSVAALSIGALTAAQRP